MTVAILIVIAVALVIVVGLLVFRLMGKAQKAVPDVADQARPIGDRVVGTDEQGRPVTEAQEPQTAPRDESAFESLLQDEIRDRGMQQPPSDEQS